MIKRCPRCNSEKIRWNSSHITMNCMNCGYKWKRNRKGLTLMERK